MTEPEWVACADAETMLEFLCHGRFDPKLWLGAEYAVEAPDGGRSYRGFDRKLYLFACACFRRIWQLLPGDRSRNGVEVLERYADGEAEGKDLVDALLCASKDLREADFPIGEYAGLAVGMVMEMEPEWAVPRYVGYAAKARAMAYAKAMAGSRSGVESEEERVRRSARVFEAAFEEERRVQCALLRDLFGPLPFRPPPPLDPAWAAWRDGAVPKMATAFYRERAFEQMPVLADVLEEAGCADEQVLAHCRGGGEHVRGCWVVDAILG